MLTMTEPSEIDEWSAVWRLDREKKIEVVDNDAIEVGEWGLIMYVLAGGCRAVAPSASNVGDVWYMI